MRKRYRELVLTSIAQRIRTEFGAPKALNAPLVAALEKLKGLPEGTWPHEDVPPLQDVPPLPSILTIGPEPKT